MHHYQHHIGDYRRDTMHLSLLEHGAYRQLLDMYYLSEEPIPAETEVVSRRLCAKTEEEKTAVQTVLNEFFEYEENVGWIHKRCAKEIEKYVAKAKKAKENGKLGGRPKGETKVVMDRFQKITKAKANHEPLTINQEPSVDATTPRKRGSRLQTDWTLPEDWKAWALKEQPSWTQAHVEKVATGFRNYWIAKSGKDAAKLDWYATWQNWVMREPALSAGGKAANWWDDDQATLAKGREYGLEPRSGEDWRAFKARINERLRVAA